MRLMAALLLLMSAVPLIGQAINPQNTFANAVTTSAPSFWLNYNDNTTAFMDQVSQTAMVSTKTVATASTVGMTGTPSAAVSAGYVVLLPTPIATSGSITTLSLQTHTAPVPGPYTCVVASGTAPSALTVVETFTVNVAATTAVQTFTAPGNFTAIPVTAGEYAGCWTSSTGTPLAYGMTGGSGFYYYAGATSVPSGVHSYITQAGPDNLAVSFGVSASSTYTSGTVTPRQAGFDSTNSTNYSAAFSNNGWMASPNNTLGAIEWSSPWSMMIQVDRLNWDRTGSIVLASKGDVGGCAGYGPTQCTSTLGSWWQLYVRMSGLHSQLCFERNGYGQPSTSGGGADTQQTLCTGANFDAMPNGFNYNIVVEGLGKGGSCNGTTCSDISMWINGLQVGSGLASVSFNVNTFGMATVNVSGGTGYASSTAFTSSGGGSNCVVAGTMAASGGVPLTSNGISFSANSGCTSIPTITLISPTGTGANITVGLGGQLMNSASAPLVLSGYVANGAYYGGAPTDASQAPTYLDEFAEFPSALSFGAISNIFYETKFYQTVANVVTPEPVMIVDDDGCGDPDNEFTLATAVGLHQAGLVNLAGAVIEDYSPTAEATWRQILDAAGLNDVPLAIPSANVGSSGTACSVANVAAYNASTPLATTAWGQAKTMYRTIFAKYPTTPIKVILGGALQGIYDFMQSPADSISPLTGSQLMARNAANGGAFYLQGGGCTASSPPATVPCGGGIGQAMDSQAGQYVTTNNGATPLIWVGGTPMSAGPGVFATRVSNDPMYLFLLSGGIDTRQCYDCMSVLAAVSSLFTGGVQIGFSGGTGYATSTAFTLSGGGKTCQGSGYLTASGGVPNGIEYSWGATGYEQSAGLGSGCSSAPTVVLSGSTGTGVTLSAYPALVCGTDSVTLTGSTWSDSFNTATCSNHYMTPGSFNTSQTPQSGAVMTWFINSLVDSPTNGKPRVY